MDGEVGFGMKDGRWGVCRERMVWFVMFEVWFGFGSIYEFVMAL